MSPNCRNPLCHHTAYPNCLNYLIPLLKLHWLVPSKKETYILGNYALLIYCRNEQILSITPFLFPTSPLCLPSPPPDPKNLWSREKNRQFSGKEMVNLRGEMGKICYFSKYRLILGQKFSAPPSFPHWPEKTAPPQVLTLAEVWI